MAKMIMTVAEMADRNAWLKMRTQGIGGSDAGTIVGLNPWKSKYELWLEKTGQVIPEDISDREPVYWGNRLEDIVAQEFTRQTGKKVRRHGMVQDEAYPFLFANVDRMVAGEKAGLECKTANGFKASLWEGDEVPASYYCQCQHYMLVTGLPVWYIACLVGGQHYVWKPIKRNEEDIQTLLEMEKAFWQCVVDRVPPEVDGSASCTEALAERFRGGVAESIELPSWAAAEVAAIRQLEAQKKELDAKIAESKNRLKEVMGDHEVAVWGTEDDGGRITWKLQKGRTSIDSKRLKADHPDIFDAYSKVGKPTRVFRIG